MAIQHIIPHTISDTRHLSNVIRSRAIILQSLLQKLDHSIHMGIVEATLDKMTMTISHVFAGIPVWATEGHGEKGDLLLPLPAHINAVKKMADALIGQDALVKAVDHLTHRLSAT